MAIGLNKNVETETQNDTNTEENKPKKMKLGDSELFRVYGGFKNIFDVEVLEILQNENISEISGDKMRSIIEIALSKINQTTAPSIFAFFLELERHQINCPVQYQKEIKGKISESMEKIKLLLPKTLSHFEFDSLSFQDENFVKKIPFSIFISDYLINLLIKTSNKEIDNSVNRYFARDIEVNFSGIDSVIKHAFDSIYCKESDQETHNQENIKKNWTERDLTEEERQMQHLKRTNVNICSNNLILYKILRKEEYNLKLFKLLLNYPEKLEQFLLFLYINSDETYTTFLQNSLEECNAEEQFQILSHFLGVKIEDVHFFNTQNISLLINKNVNQEILLKRIADLPKEDILELLKENFVFFIGKFDIFEISARELIQASEESDEILEYVFSHASEFGSFVIGSIMRILSGKSPDYVLKFFKKKIYELKKFYENPKPDELSTENDLENTVCEGILIFLKHNQINSDLVEVFKSEYLLKNEKYFLSVISILDKSKIRARIFAYLNENTIESFISAISPNEMLDELCFVKVNWVHDSFTPDMNRLVECVDLLLTKTTESGVIQTMMQVEDSPNFLIIMKLCVQKMPGLKSFITTALRRNTKKNKSFLLLLEELGDFIGDVLVTKDIPFIKYCLSESQIIQNECEKYANNGVQGFERISKAIYELNDTYH